MRYDLVIVGGGLVGAGLAVALKKSNLRIALIDARMPSNNDPRLFALNSYSCRFLNNLGVWNRLAPHAEAIHQVHASSRGHFGVVKLSREDVNIDALGYVIPAYQIEAALNDELASVQVYRPATLQLITVNDDVATLSIDMGGELITIESAIVVAADGAESTVRTQLSMPTETVDYQQTAIVTRTSLKRAHANIAYERFNGEGAIAMLPLPGNECATIWTTESDIAKSLMQLSEEDFLRALQTTFGYRLGRLEKISRRFSFPLKLVHAKQMALGPILLLGNSAHSMHPIAAQGFNLALYEVAMLVDLVASKQSAGAKVTAADLRDICQQAAGHQEYSVKMSHRLAGLFAGDSLLKKHAISLGMTGLNMLKPARATFINLMMGRRGMMPRLLTTKGQ